MAHHFTVERSRRPPATAHRGSRITKQSKAVAELSALSPAAPHVGLRPTRPKAGALIANARGQRPAQPVNGSAGTAVHFHTLGFWGDLNFARPIFRLSAEMRKNSQDIACQSCTALIHFSHCSYSYFYQFVHSVTSVFNVFRIQSFSKTVCNLDVKLVLLHSAPFSAVHKLFLPAKI